MATSFDNLKIGPFFTQHSGPKYLITIKVMERKSSISKNIFNPLMYFMTSPYVIRSSKWRYSTHIQRDWIDLIYCFLNAKHVLHFLNIVSFYFRLIILHAELAIDLYIHVSNLLLNYLLNMCNRYIRENDFIKYEHYWNWPFTFNNSNGQLCFYK